MFMAVRYLPIPRELRPADSVEPRSPRCESLVDISLLLYLLNPVTTAEEEAMLRRLRVGPAALRPTASRGESV
jgi:hypothetical protein